MRVLTPVLLLALAGCGKKPAPAETAATPAPSAANAKLAAEVEATLDRSVDACEDFYQFACGGWLKNNTIPGDRSRWSRSFSTIADHNEAVLKSLLEEAAADSAATGERKLVSTYYGTCMDDAARNEAGMAPLAAHLEKIDGIKTDADLMKVSADLGMIGLNPFFGVWVDQDYKNPDMTILGLSQGGLSLPSREYYLEEGFAEQRTAYEAHLGRVFEQLGSKDAAADAKAVLSLETELAKISKPRAELRDPEKTYNKMDRAGLDKLAALPWGAWFEATPLAETDINVTTPEYFTQLVGVLAATPMAARKAYLRYHLVHEYSDALPDTVDQEFFGFYGTVLSGVKEQPERWKRCARATDSAIGHPLSKLYVERQFSGDSKPVAVQMVKDLESAFVDSLPDLAWMDDTTRERAETKAHKITNKIGYPDAWRDYSGLELGSDYVAAKAAANRFNNAWWLAKAGKAPDPNQWYMTPPTVNAYYNPGQNEIVFPAGILQPPFFDVAYPAALNYGAIGMVIGHEITHGFDDSGRKFDGDGKLSEWWEPEVSTRYEARAECVKDQYSKYEAQPGQFVNGELTLGENIADLGGLKQSHTAYLAHAQRNGLNEEVAGFNGEQLVFLAFAQSWCSLSTPEREVALLKSDTHSPPRFRVNGSVRNYDRFGEVFDCEVGTPMRPAKDAVCEVW